MHVHEIAERFSLLMEAYLRGCGTLHRSELVKQVEIMDQFAAVAGKIKQVTKKEERIELLRHLLRQVEFPERFQIPLFTHIELKRLLIDKCRVMVRQYTLFILRFSLSLSLFMPMLFFF